MEGSVLSASAYAAKPYLAFSDREAELRLEILTQRHGGRQDEEGLHAGFHPLDPFRILDRSHFKNYSKFGSRVASRASKITVRAADGRVPDNGQQAVFPLVPWEKKHTRVRCSVKLL